MPLATIQIGLDPVLVHVGSLAVRWYGVMYVVGITAGILLAQRYAEQRGIDRDTAYAIFWPLVVAGLVGGRLYYVVQSDLGWYLQHPQQILATWEGGMAFYGAVFLCIPVAYVMCRLKDVSFAVVLDCAAIFITVAQTFGRVGNVVNGDILGYPSNLPWATQYTNPNNTFVPTHTQAYDPAAIYELLFGVALFALIWFLRNRFKVPGTLFVVWIVAYSVGQFLLFFARANTVILLGLKQAQLTAIVVVLVSVPAWLIWRRMYLRTHRDWHPSEAAVVGGAP